MPETNRTEQLETLRTHLEGIQMSAESALARLEAGEFRDETLATLIETFRKIERQMSDAELTW